MSIASGRRRTAAATLVPKGIAGLFGALMFATFPAFDASAAATPAAAAPAATSTTGGTERATNPDPVRDALAAARAAADAGDHERALAILEDALRGNQRDARLRFARAVQLAQAGREQLALQAFTELTQEFPELPEPHNNLATIHASRGELDLALMELEMALRVKPGYALALENLGDLYLRLAERSYRQAAQSQPANESLRAKLTMAREMIGRIIAPPPGPK